MLRLVMSIITVFCFMSWADPTLAQTTTGRITGTVSDESGALIPGVEVAVRSSASGLSRTAITNESGTYQVPLLQPGLYTVEASLDGFQRAVRSGVTVAVEAVVRVDFRLAVGQRTDVVQVIADAPLVQNETATLGQVMDNQKITAIPLNQRHFMSLTQLTTGVLPDVQGGDRQSPSFYANGVNRNKNDFLLDGVDNNDTGNAQLVIIPSVDAIQEFKLSTSTYGAELGRASGGVLNVTTRPGTNDFHATFFEFLRNDALDARNFFATEKQPYKRNQFGTVISGPVVRNRLFFLFNYEGNRVRNTETALRRVPSLAERAGDFSEFGKPLIDPLTGQQFAGNIVPAGRINPISNNIATFYPEPNRSLSGGSNYVANSKRITNFDFYTWRVDHQISDKQHLFFRGTWQDTYEIQTNFDRGTLPRGGNTFFQPLGRNFALSDTIVLGSRAVNEARVGFNRLIGGIYDETYGTDYAKQLGVTGVQSSFRPDERRFGWPRASLTGYAPIGTAGFSAQLRFDNTWHWYDMLALTRGNHQMKIGGEVRTYMLNIFIDTNPNGSFTFDGRYSGNAFADMLLGYPSRTARKVGDPYTQSRSRSVAAFFQDDWKFRRTLTLNLGIRWEMYTRSINVLKDEGRGFAAFHMPTQQIVIGGERSTRMFRDPVSGEPNAIAIAGGAQYGIPDGLYNNDYNDFGPRIGFAWSPDSAWFVMRGGYGIFIEPEIAAQNHSNRDSAYPWVLPQTFIASSAHPNITMNDPFPEALGRSSITARASDPNQRDGYVQQWQLSLQRPLGSNMVLELAYAGTKGTKLSNSRDINAPVLGAGSVNSRRPAPEWGGISQQERANLSNYHSLQTKLERRFSAGLTFVSAWTWSHSIECCDGAVDPYNLSAGRAQSSFDVRHRQVNSFSYEIPIGNGKHLLSGLSGPANAILGGWQIAGIATFSNGQSFTPSVSGDIAQVGASSSRPDRVGDGILPRSQRNADHWFDTSAFVVSAPGTFGNSGANVLKSPGLNNWDFTLMKNTEIGENHRLEFRVEFFNAFNHANFNIPNSTVNSPQFGTITDSRPGRQIQFGLKYYLF